MQALEGLFDLYLAAIATMNAVHRPQMLNEPRPCGVTEGELVALEASTPDWLDTEYPNILAAIQADGETGLYTRVWQLVHNLHGFPRIGSQGSDWIDAVNAGLAAAEVSRNPVAFTAMRLALADVRRSGSSETLAFSHSERALLAAERAVWPEAEAAALSSTGRLQWAAGNLEEAQVSLNLALQRCRAMRYRAGEAVGLGSLGQVHHDAGQLLAAERYYRRSLSICHETKSRNGQALSLFNLGVLNADLGRIATSLRHLEGALRISREMGLLQCEFLAMAYAIAVRSVADNPISARVMLEDVVTFAKQTDDPRVASEVLNCVGDVFYKLGNSDLAISHYGEAVYAARSVRYLRGELRSLIGTARAYISLEEYGNAALTCSEALACASNHKFRLFVLRAKLAHAQALVLSGRNIDTRRLLLECQSVGFYPERTWAHRILAAIDAQPLPVRSTGSNATLSPFPSSG